MSIKVAIEPIEIDYYTLKQYAEASYEHKLLVNEKDRVIQDLYDDISPTITCPDYDTGLLFTRSSHTESTALEIIYQKSRYEAMIKKWEWKAKVFDQAMDTLEPRERDVIMVHYFGRQNDLGLSVQYYRDTLETAQIKLCAFLELNKANTLEALKEREKQAIRERVQAV